MILPSFFTVSLTSLSRAAILAFKSALVDASLVLSQSCWHKSLAFVTSGSLSCSSFWRSCHGATHAWVHLVLTEEEHTSTYQLHCHYEHNEDKYPNIMRTNIRDIEITFSFRWLSGINTQQLYMVVCHCFLNDNVNKL